MRRSPRRARLRFLDRPRLLRPVRVARAADERSNPKSCGSTSSRRALPTTKLLAKSAAGIQGVTRVCRLRPHRSGPFLLPAIPPRPAPNPRAALARRALQGVGCWRLIPELVRRDDRRAVGGEHRHFRVAPRRWRKKRKSRPSSAATSICTRGRAQRCQPPPPSRHHRPPARLSRRDRRTDRRTVRGT